MKSPEIVNNGGKNVTADAEREQKLKDPGFGKLFSDHMVRAHYDADKGWHSAEVCARERISLDPSANVLHYGQAIFEGMKAYRRGGEKVVAFRPNEHADRFNDSAKRMAMPSLPPGFLLKSVQALVDIDRKWVPKQSGHSFYLRPTMIATESCLGVRPAKTYLYFLIASPCAAYFSKGVAPVNVWATKDYSRAAPGGTGAAKTAGNYGASLIAQQQAIENGCEQVIWLDAVEHRFVEELGGMNLFFVWKDGNKKTLVTPPLSETILPGVTRRSLIQLAKDNGIAVNERKVSLSEVIEGTGSGQLLEAFACGTAAVVTPIGKIKSTEGEWTVHKDGLGPVAGQLRERLVGIHDGSGEDTHNWVHEFD